MTIKDLTEAVLECERFVRQARAAKTRYELEQWKSFGKSKECAAVKRSSMDLSRALSHMRRRR